MESNVNFRPDENLGIPGEVEFEPSRQLGAAEPSEGRVEELKSRASEKADELRSRASEKADELKNRAFEQADASRFRAADQLDRASDMLEERARDMEMRGGMQGRASNVARQASDQLDRSADYVRTHQMDEMRDDLETQIRSHPLASVGIALGAGFVLGRMIS